MTRLKCKLLKRALVQVFSHPTPGRIHIPSDQEMHPAAVVDFLKKTNVRGTPPTHTHTGSEIHTLKDTQGPNEESQRVSIPMTSRVSGKQDADDQ